MMGIRSYALGIARRRIFRRLMKGGSISHESGILIVDLSVEIAQPHHRQRVAEAIDLVLRQQPWRRESLAYWLPFITIVRAGGQLYQSDIRACLLDVPYIEASSVEWLAGVIVHEATHARLDRRGFEQRANLGPRLE